MSIDYRGRLKTGYLTNLTSSLNAERYTISTIWNARTREWETSAFKRSLFGAFRPLLCINAQDEGQAMWVHNQVERIAEQESPEAWAHAKLRLIHSNGYAVASKAGFFQEILKATGREQG